MAKTRARRSSGSPHALSSRFLPSLCPITDSYPPFPESSSTSSPRETAQLAKHTSAERSSQCPVLPPAAPLWAGLVTAYTSHRISWGQHQSFPGVVYSCLAMLTQLWAHCSCLLFLLHHAVCLQTQPFSRFSLQIPISLIPITKIPVSALVLSPSLLHPLFPCFPTSFILFSSPCLICLKHYCEVIVHTIQSYLPFLLYLLPRISFLNFAFPLEEAKQALHPLLWCLYTIYQLSFLLIPSLFASRLSFGDKRRCDFYLQVTSK